VAVGVYQTRAYCVGVMVQEGNGMWSASTLGGSTLWDPIVADHVGTMRQLTEYAGEKTATAYGCRVYTATVPGWAVGIMTHKCLLVVGNVVGIHSHRTLMCIDTTMAST